MADADGAWRQLRHSTTPVSFFRELDAEPARRIFSLGVRRIAAPGEVLFLKGQAGDALYGVLSGHVRISTSVPSGREVVLTTMGPGQVFGEIALLDGGPRTADAAAITRTELLVVRRSALLRLLEREPKLAVGLLRLVCERVRRVSGQVEDAALLDLPSRLAKQLLAMAERHGEPSNEGLRVRLQPSQSELGHTLGTSRVTINKHLQRWRRRGWVALARGEVLIRDRAALKRLAEDSRD